MGKTYLKKLPEIYEYAIEDLEEDVRMFETSGLPKIAGAFYSSNALSFKSIGICEYLLKKDVAQMKNKFYNAAISGLKSLKWYDTQIGKIHISNALSMINYNILEYALISEDGSLTARVAEALGERDELDSLGIGQVAYHKGYAIKYVVLDEYKKAAIHIEKLLAEKPIDFIVSYAGVLTGIIDGDSEGVNASLEKMLKYYKKLRDNNNTPEEFLCLPAIALAKLAKSKDIGARIDDSLAPKEIIDHSEVDYQLVNFLKSDDE